MKNLFIFINLAIITFLICSATNPAIKNPDAALTEISGSNTVEPVLKSKTEPINFGKTPLYFIPNKGQVNPTARFYAQASQYTLWLTREGFIFDNARKITSKTGPRKKSNKTFNPPDPPSPPSPSPRAVRDVSRLVFPGANTNPELISQTPTPHRVNYFIGSNPHRWRTRIPTWETVIYKNLYHHIDLKVYGIEKQVEYDWIIKPGANPGNIQLRYKNIRNSTIDDQGNLVIETQWGKWQHKNPVAYQWTYEESNEYQGEKTKQKKYIEVNFKSIAKHTYGFEIDKYDTGRELIIDPVVVPYSTYLGGNAWEEGYAVAIDNSGTAYVAGGTWSTDFPVKDQYQTDPGSENADIFITKIDTTQKGSSSLIYSTYLGGSGEDGAYGIAVDNSGNAYITGFTWSTDFPNKNAFQGHQGTQDVFVTKLNTTISGTAALVYSTYLGGEKADCGEDIALDSSGNVYITGWTYGINFPLKNAFRTESKEGFTDGFVTKINPAKSGSSSLVYSTYLGGDSSDGGTGIAVDNSSNAYISGWTYSADFTSKNAYKSHQGLADAFITQIDTSKSGSSSLIYSTCLGGSNSDYGEEIALEENTDYVYITGITRSTNFPTKNQYQSYQNDDDVFIARLNTSKSGSSSLIYSTCLGGNGEDSGYAIATDLINSGIVYVSGSTASSNFPTKSPYQSYQGNGDVFITQLDTNRSGSAGLLFSTYLGGSRSDGCNSIIADSDGNIYLTGWTFSVNFPKVNPYGTDPGDSDCDSFLSKMYIETIQGTPTIQLNRTAMGFSAVTGGAQTGAQPLSISNTGAGTLEWTATASDTWIEAEPANGTGDSVVDVSINANGLGAGQYTGTLSISDTNAANSPQSVEITLTVYNTGSTASPFGQFSTPEEGTTLSSSIPVTGWVLDDVGVTGVKIYRSEGKSLVYIGDAVFVEGARPDIEMAYPGYPMNYQAGWGYMMLTHFLPNGGNGTYTIHAVAHDMEGNEVTLGTKTITVDNENAIKPFGALDTPGQGGIAAGNDFINWGWALTPQPNTIPTDGTTLNVWVDGVNLGHAKYNINRPDIAQLFPGYNNSEGAAGYFSLDTTAYSNGIHTIQWTAKDDAGNSDGIGSRYFSIQNSTNRQQSATKKSSSQQNPSIYNKPPPPMSFNTGETDWTGQYSEYSESPIRVLKGYNTSTQHQKTYPNDRKTITVEIEELERLEIHLGESNLLGNQMVGNHLRPLPIGSTMDVKEGVFYWQPGPGYLGYYHLVFYKSNRKNKKIGKNIQVIIIPKKK